MSTSQQPSLSTKNQNSGQNPMTQSSKLENSNSCMNVEVKSKLTGSKHQIMEVCPDSNTLKFYKNEKSKSKSKGKQYKLNQIRFSKSPRKNNLILETKEGKNIQIKSQNCQEVEQNINKGKQINEINQFSEQSMKCIPKHINYSSAGSLQRGTSMQLQKIKNFQDQQEKKQTPKLSTLAVLDSEKKKIKEQTKLQPKTYPRRKWYLNPEDWKQDKKGGLIFINQPKKKNQSKIVKFVLKKFVSTGSFMGISFPAFAMKPESILQSYAKAIGLAPVLFQNILISVERMKKFVAFLHSFSILFADLDKPFNPVIGETFQASIAGGSFSAEQVCHHPPISSFFYEGKGYKLYGTMEMSANIGANSATGYFVGDLVLKYDDGTQIKGRLPAGQFSGFVIGDNKFETLGSAYAYDNKKLICSFTAKKNNIFEGFIGRLKPKYQQQFFTNVKKSSRFEKFSFYNEKCYQATFSRLTLVYNKSTSFDGKQYLNLTDPKYLPYVPQPISDQSVLLKSDSKYRADIPLRGQGKVAQSQEEKQKIQQLQRYNRGLREKAQGFKK